MKERLFRNEKFWITYWKENAPMNELCSLSLNNRSLKCLKMFSYFLFSAHNTYTIPKYFIWLPNIHPDPRENIRKKLAMEAGREKTDRCDLQVRQDSDN